ncbi:MAG: serine hydrolase domain-containing protein [Corynebacterium sp.]|nr:serine hydrolase domain-containing protein [Corynebacterium sp.]
MQIPDISSWPIDNTATALITSDAITTTGDQDKVFELASVTKVLAAYGFLIAVEEGVFELDEEVSGHNVRQLLAHASGVGFKESDPQKPPLKRRIYSSYGYEILAQEVYERSGIPFAEYLDEAVFAPLGMRNSELWGSAGHEARSTAADVSKFAQEILDPQLLAPQTLREAMSVQFPELSGIVPGYGMQKPCPWGLGFEIKGEKSPHWTGSSLPAQTIGHFGQAGTFLWALPEKGAAMVFLGDRAFGDWVKPYWDELNTAIGKQLLD